MVEAGVKSPMDFTLGVARGFHNAPKLYGDESVRQTEKITDLQTGLKAAGKVEEIYFPALARLMLSGVRLRFIRRHFGPGHTAH